MSPKMLSNKSIKEIIQKLKEGQIKVIDLVEYYLERINTLNDKYNAYLFVRDKSEIIKEAYEIQKEIDFGTTKKLAGIPFSLKDSFMAIGTPTTAGDRYLENEMSKYNAVIVDKLFNEGAILLGKTNMDSWGFGNSTQNSAYGSSRNPYDSERIPGGSSGGAAVALALDMCAFSIGEDTGGSIRNPASSCGIYGLKPTYGRISRFGCIAYASSLDTVGFFTKTASDLSLIFEILSTEDDNDCTYVKYEGEKNLKKKLAYSLDLVPQEINKSIRENYLQTVEKFKQIGYEAYEVSFPLKDALIPTYYITAMAEASTNLARYHGTRYGKLFNEIQDNNFDFSRFNIHSWHDLFTKSRTEGFTSEAKKRIIAGAFALSEGYYDDYYNLAQKIRMILEQELDRIFQNCDCILSPVTPNLPRKLTENYADPVSSYMEDIYTVTANLAGIPAIAFPTGFEENLPIGMQIMGPRGSEEILIEILCEISKIN